MCERVGVVVYGCVGGVQSFQRSTSSLRVGEKRTHSHTYVSIQWSEIKRDILLQTKGNRIKKNA